MASLKHRGGEVRRIIVNGAKFESFPDNQPRPEIDRCLTDGSRIDGLDSTKTKHGHAVVIGERKLNGIVSPGVTAHVSTLIESTT